MEDARYEELKKKWNQQSIPVIFRPGGSEKLRVRTPYQKDNREWLKVGHRINPEWIKDKKYWSLPKSWFNDLVNKCLNKYGKVYVIQPYREQEKCAPACWNAIGHECNCSCMGEHHGAHGGNSSWLVISEAFATRWGDKQYACRTLSKAVEQT
ncbi:hypothetical protein Q670_04220 [Alcanivorax sp. P2S70]|uniref:hypothetical protein n=1 Tax=Alcanivorax sp. P2S70 TaxID=1397527 RepID=UPI0003B74053|nr:hypothetical protein [Alcanivorax sp. P2S70]ERP89607.1 hypothetical protein Q670_04220 [Alcanivorax sp. P2S70]